MIRVLSFLLVASLLPAAPLPDAVYTEVAAGVPDGVLDLTTVPGPGVYEMTNAKPGLVFNVFNNVTVLAEGVTLKPTENVVTAIEATGGTQFSGGTNRLQLTGKIDPGTTQLQCHYVTGEPVVSFLGESQALRTGSTFTLADPTGFTLCYWIWGDSPLGQGGLFSKAGLGAVENGAELYVYAFGGAPDFWVGSGVTAVGGGYARITDFALDGENGRWNFFCLYFNQAGNQMGVSRNGGAFTTLATAGTLTAPATLTTFSIGGHDVKMSNVWLWKGRVLTLAEAQAIYNGGAGKRYADLSTGQKTGLLHAWEMNEATGVDREDAHGSNDLDEVSGPIAQYRDGWTGTVEHPLTDIMAVGDRCQVSCGLQIYDAQEPQYTVFREIASIAGNTITFSEPFPLNCIDHVDSATVLAAGGDPQKVGVWGGDGEAVPYLHPFSPGANSFGYYQRGWGTSHDIVLYESGHPNSGLTVKNLTIDYSSSTHTQVGGCAQVYNAENVRFEDLTMIRYRGTNAILFNRSNNSGVDGFTIRGDATGAQFGAGTNFSTYACSLWGGTGTYFRNVDIRGNGIALFNGESGSIDAIVENTRLVGGSPTAGQTWFGQHFGSYASHFQTDGVVGVKFRNCYFDTRSDSSTYFPSTTAGFQCTNIALAGGEFSDQMPFTHFEGYIRIGKRIFGPRTPLTYNFQVTFDGTGAVPDLPMPVGLYLPWPVLTIDTRSGFNMIRPASVNLLDTNPGTVLNFANTGGDGNMVRWTTGYVYIDLSAWLALHTISFYPTGTPTATHDCTFTATYFPEVTSTIGPKTPVLASTGGVLRAANGKAIALVATP